MKLTQTNSGDTFEINTIKGKKVFEAKVTIIEFNDNGYDYFYCPSLEIIANGKTAQSAKESFEYIFQETMVYCITKKTLKNYLFQNGWASIIDNKKYTNSGFFNMIKFKPEISERLANIKDFNVHNSVLLSA